MKLLKYTLLATSLFLSGMNHWASAEELKDMKRLFLLLNRPGLAFIGILWMVIYPKKG